MWLIYNAKENLYWCIDMGWVDRMSATSFSTKEKLGIPYLPGVGSTWVAK